MIDVFENRRESVAKGHALGLLAKFELFAPPERQSSFWLDKRASSERVMPADAPTEA